MVVSISGVYPCSLLPDWELWLTALAQHHKTVSYHISLTQKKIQIPNLKYSFYFRTIVKYIIS